MNIPVKNLTPWFCTELFQYPDKNKIGVYQCLHWMPTFGAPLEVIGFIYWDGRRFGSVRYTHDDALRFSTSKNIRPIVWRGLKDQSL